MLRKLICRSENRRTENQHTKVPLANPQITSLSLAGPQITVIKVLLANPQITAHGYPAYKRLWGIPVWMVNPFRADLPHPSSLQTRQRHIRVEGDFHI